MSKPDSTETWDEMVCQRGKRGNVVLKVGTATWAGEVFVDLLTVYRPHDGGPDQPSRRVPRFKRAEAFARLLELEAMVGKARRRCEGAASLAGAVPA